MNEENFAKLFSNKKLAVKVESINDIRLLQKFINKYLFEDTSLVYAKEYHGTYGKWLGEGYKLAIGKCNDLVEVLDRKYFTSHEYRFVDLKEFTENVLMW